jgi:hypothetical protein
VAYCFGDGFDLYATMADPIAGYWDSGFGVAAANTLVAGRFAGSQAVSLQSGIASLVKNSGANDAIHHIVCAVRQTAALSGTTLGMYFQLSDAATNQCCIVFRSDGVVLLTSATPAGTVLATYSGAVTAANTWTAFEFEVIISNTVGRFRARKNGNTSDDFDSGATLNTRPGANAYANKLTVGMQATVNAQQVDDLLWRSDTASVPFVGDIRAYTRMPASDVSTQFARAPDPFPLTPNTAATTATPTAGNVRLVSFTPTVNGTLTSASISVNAAATAHVKAAIYAADRSTVLATSSEITNPVAGGNVVTFTPGLAVTKGTQYYFATDQDASVTYNSTNSLATTYTGTCAYASFPGAPITGMSANSASPIFTLSFATPNHQMVAEPQQDGAASYVYDSTVGHSDLYGIAALAATPVSVVAVTTRGFVQKSDAGTRNGAVQLKSGATTVQSTSTALSTTFGWLWRTDATDPATGAAWTPVAVNNVSIGPVCTL